MDNVERTRDYFNKSIDRLKSIKETKQREVIKETALFLKGRLEGKVLDIGSGGRIDYSLDNINRLVSLDISPKSLRKVYTNNKVEFIISDARKLNMENNSFDRVVLLHVIHHLAGDDLASTYNNIKACFKESYRVLRKGGRILIVDAFLNKMAYNIEKALFGLLFSVLRMCGKPMVYYFSLSDIVNILNKVGFEDEYFYPLNTGNAKLCPFTSPVGIPFKYTPLSHILIEGRK